jgi:hypothetical protein
MASLPEDINIQKNIIIKLLSSGVQRVLVLHPTLLDTVDIQSECNTERKVFPHLKIQ